MKTGLKSSEALDELRYIGRNPIESAKNDKSCKKAVGLILTDAPVELLTAAKNVCPVQIFSHHGPAGKGREHFQSFTCSYGRGSLDLLLGGDLDFLDGVITPFICDTTRCIDIVLRDRKPYDYIECFRLPKSLAGPGAKEYLMGEIRRLRNSISHFAGEKITDKELTCSIKAHNKSRDLLRKFEPLRNVDAMAYFEAIRAYTVISVEKFNAKMEEALNDIGPIENARALPIMLAGKLAEPFDLPGLLESMGASIVADDMAIGARLFARDVEENMDPIEALAERQLKQIPFAGLLQSEEDRPDYLVRRVRETGAKAVILVVHKFCEIFELDAPEVRERLKRENIPALILVTDFHDKTPGPEKTRVQAFLEMLKND